MNFALAGPPLQPYDRSKQENPELSLSSGLASLPQQVVLRVLEKALSQLGSGFSFLCQSRYLLLEIISWLDTEKYSAWETYS